MMPHANHIKRTKSRHRKSSPLNTETLDEAGTLDAEPGSRPWAIAMRHEICGALKTESIYASYLQKSIEIMQAKEGYRSLCDSEGRPFKSHDDFCRHRPPWGLGKDPIEIKCIITRRLMTDAQRAAEAAPLFKNGTNRFSEKDSPSPRRATYGANPDYELARLKRDAQDDPDKAKLLQEVEAGERTIASAAKEAGIRSPRFSVIISRDRSVIARCILRNLSRYLPPDQVDEIVQMMATTVPSRREP